MKKCIILILIICITSCNQKKESDNSSQPFTSGKWYIIDYQKNGQEKQDLYSGFDFTFSNDNHITAKRGNHNYSGEWVILKSEITDDAPRTDIDFKIIFKKYGLSELNGDWKIEKKTSDYISLYQVNNNGENRLIFKKS